MVSVWFAFQYLPNDTTHCVNLVLLKRHPVLEQSHLVTHDCVCELITRTEKLTWVERVAFLLFELCLTNPNGIWSRLSTHIREQNFMSIDQSLDEPDYRLKVIRGEHVAFLLFELCLTTGIWSRMNTRTKFHVD